MQVRNLEYATAVQGVFLNAPFVHQLGVRLESVKPGICRARLEITSHHLQHLGRIHGGVISTLAGHTALGAAMSVASPEVILVSPDQNLKLFRSADNGTLQAVATVIKAGAMLIFVESEVFLLAAQPLLLAKGSFTFTSSAPA